MTFCILQGNCLDVLKTIPTGIVQTCVTSPPYFGLRDYGTASWKGGSVENCDHLGEPMRTSSSINANWGDGFADVKNKEKRQPMGAHCTKCGAKRIDQQIGLEPTPQAFVDQLVQVFREVRRVLRDDGTLWLNLGDSYNAYNGGAGPSSSLSRGAQTKARPQLETGYGLKFKGLKPKDLLGIPWRVAFALQQDGWYLRQDIIWHKPNPMPESVRDRCTKAHEYIFLLSKSEKYFFDAEAIKEPLARPDEGARKTPARFGGADKWEEAQKQSRLHSGNEYVGTPNGTRNKRSVWTVSPKPFKEAHFATFPPQLIEPCILAGAPVGGLVLDPFGGAGTTALVSEQNKRHSISIELNPAYVEMAKKRVASALDSPPQS